LCKLFKNIDEAGTRELHELMSGCVLPAFFSSSEIEREMMEAFWFSFFARFFVNQDGIVGWFLWDIFFLDQNWIFLLSVVIASFESLMKQGVAIVEGMRNLTMSWDLIQRAREIEEKMRKIVPPSLLENQYFTFLTD